MKERRSNSVLVHVIFSRRNIKRLMSCVLSILFIQCIPFGEISVFASTNGYTRESAAYYMLNTILGYGWNVDGGGVGYDCKDLALKYFEDVGGLHIYELGHARIYADSATLPDGWTRQYCSNGYSPKKGDMACWGSEYGSGYGHVALVYDVDDTYIYVVEQSSSKNVAAYKSSYRITSPKCYVVPDFLETPFYTPTASTDRKLYCIGQNVTFSFSADGASSLNLYIYLDGSKYFEGGFNPSDTYSRDLWTTGHYAYFIVAHYPSGDIDSSWNDFNVVDNFLDYVPAKPEIWFDRDTVALGQSITIHRWSETAQYYSTSIYKNGVLISNNQDGYGVYSVTLSSVGEYKVVTSAINEYGESEYAESYFEVYNTIPDKPDIWTDESSITQGTEFSVHHWSKYALFYSMSVYKDGTLIQNQQNYTSSSTVSLNAVGDYKIVASAINEYGESEYAETYITIASGIPQVPLLWVDNAYVPLGTDAVIHRWSESAKYYSSSFYLNDVLILNNQDSYGVFSVVLTDPGYYKVVTQAINDHGSSGCSEVFFTVYNTIPEEPEIMIQKNYYAPNETITMEINNRALAKESYLSVRNETTGEVVIGPGLHFSQLPNSYSFTVDSDGEYCIEYQTVNEFGSSICASKQFVVVSERLAGDANQDGNVNLKDVVFIRRYLAGGWSVILDKYNSDVNGDLTVDLKDATILTRYLAGGWGVQLA